MGAAYEEALTGIPDSSICNISVAVEAVAAQPLQYLTRCCIPNIDKAILIQTSIKKRR
jgi:hypothetical protein